MMPSGHREGSGAERATERHAALPQHILDQLAYADCSVCGEIVTTKGRATHVVCDLAMIEAGHAPPQTWIVGFTPKDQP